MNFDDTILKGTFQSFQNHNDMHACKSEWPYKSNDLEVNWGEGALIIIIYHNYIGTASIIQIIYCIAGIYFLGINFRGKTFRKVLRNSSL